MHWEHLTESIPCICEGGRATQEGEPPPCVAPHCDFLPTSCHLQFGLPLLLYLCRIIFFPLLASITLTQPILMKLSYEAVSKLGVSQAWVYLLLGATPFFTSTQPPSYYPILALCLHAVLQRPSLSQVMQDGKSVAVKYTLTPDLIAMVFAEKPHVRRAFDKNVPTHMSEKEFWTRYLKNEMSKEVRMMGNAR